jgi:hypothetical protein
MPLLPGLAGQARASASNGASTCQISPVFAGPCLAKDITALGTVPAARTRLREKICLDQDAPVRVKFKFNQPVASYCTRVPLGNSNKLFNSGSCPILVLATVLIYPRHADAKNDVKHYQRPTTSRENTIQKYHDPSDYRKD